ncbi:hypothetical protein CPJCM30710_33780 [Clostridium polyendosporum]|uniref:Uncharacterized protein n=1 Tax=Clostridium polyendosporum TaxID=69208 RepID=A0A919S2V3_9CLOT|nr:hypothetical protein [Clostridium polyendosporum]GIM30712.1 hypothetical protein CPJCM30710_33780 [Clostridium polyendosporum]
MSKKHDCCYRVMPYGGAAPYNGVAPYSGVAPYAGSGFGGCCYWIWFLLIILFFCNRRGNCDL